MQAIQVNRMFSVAIWRIYHFACRAFMSSVSS